MLKFLYDDENCRSPIFLTDLMFTKLLLFYVPYSLLIKSNTLSFKLIATMLRAISFVEKSLYFDGVNNNLILFLRVIILNIIHNSK
jgi:hypothetical protein